MLNRASLQAVNKTFKRFVKISFRRKENNSICLMPPRVELWAIGMGFVVLLFFIEIVNRLENEWKLKWQSLEGMLDQPNNAQQVRITMIFNL